MADGALCLVDSPAAQGRRRVSCQLSIPGDVIRVHIEQTGLRIEGRTTPFSPAVKPREDDGWPLCAQGDELSGAAETAKFRACPFMRRSEERRVGKGGQSEWCTT